MLLTWRIVLFFLLFIGQFPLQYFLSTREGNWPAGARRSAAGPTRWIK